MFYRNQEPRGAVGTAALQDQRRAEGCRASVTVRVTVTVTGTFPGAITVTVTVAVMVIVTITVGSPCGYNQG